MLGPEVGGGLHTFAQRINELVGVVSRYLQGRVAGRASAGMDDAEVRTVFGVINPPVLLLQVVQDALAELVRRLYDLQRPPPAVTRRRMRRPSCNVAETRKAPCARNFSNDTFFQCGGRAGTPVSLRCGFAGASPAWRR